MQIKSIYKKNLKGKTGSQELTGRDIFMGPNGIGKTTELQTLGLSLLGYVPENGKKNEETMKLATGNEMVAGLEMDSGFKFARTFTKTAKEDKKTGSSKIEISQSVTVSPSKGEKTTTEKEARILAEVGSFPVMLDFKEFLGLSDAKRRDFFYNISPITSESWDKVSVTKYLMEKLLSEELKDNNSDKFEAIYKCIEESIIEYPDGFDVQAGLTAMMDFVSNKLSFWKKENVKSEGAVQKLTDYKNQLDETDRGIAANKQLIEDHRKKVIELASQIAGDEQKKIANDKRTGDIFSLKVDIEAWQAKENPDDVTALTSEIEEHKKKLIPLLDYTKIREELAATIIEIKKAIEDLQSDYSISKQLISTSQGKINEFQSTIATVNSVESARTDEKPVGRCVINSLISCDKDFAAFHKHATAKIAELQIEVDSNTKDLEALKKQIDEGNKQLKDIEKQKEDTFTNEAEVIKNNTLYNGKIDVLKTRIVSGNGFSKLKEDTIAEKQLALKNIEDKAPEVISDIVLMGTQKEGIESQITGLNEKITEQEKAKTTIMHLQSSMIDDKLSGYYADAFKLIQDAIGAKGIQGEIVKSILEPIKNDIQDKLTAIGVPHKFYFSTESDTGKEIFQFGWYNEEKGYLNFDALSGGEGILLLIALVITIIERSDPKLKILMIDEIQNLDIHNFENVVKGLSVIGCNLDNIILSGVVDQYVYDPGSCEFLDDMYGFKIHNLAKKE